MEANKLAFGSNSCWREAKKCFDQKTLSHWVGKTEPLVNTSMGFQEIHRWDFLPVQSQVNSEHSRICLSICLVLKPLHFTHHFSVYKLLNYSLHCILVMNVPALSLGSVSTSSTAHTVIPNKANTLTCRNCYWQEVYFLSAIKVNLRAGSVVLQHCCWGNWGRVLHPIASAAPLRESRGFIDHDVMLGRTESILSFNVVFHLAFSKSHFFHSFPSPSLGCVVF